MDQGASNQGISRKCFQRLWYIMIEFFSIASCCNSFWLLTLRLVLKLVPPAPCTFHDLRSTCSSSSCNSQAISAESADDVATDITFICCLFHSHKIILLPLLLLMLRGWRCGCGCRGCIAVVVVVFVVVVVAGIVVVAVVVVVAAVIGRQYAVRRLFVSGSWVAKSAK